MGDITYEVAALAAAAVATVKTDPPKEVTSPAPEVARVRAEPPSWVTTVKTEPPIADGEMGQTKG